MLPSGPLHRTFATDGTYADKVFQIGVKSPSTGLQRKFRQATSTFKGVDQMPYDLLRRVDFAARITVLSIAHALWLPLAHLLLPFPQLQELTLTLEAPLDAQTRSLCSGPGAISCSLLRILCISSVCGALFLRTSWLAEFVASSVRDAALLLSTLRLVDVILDGVTAPLVPLFKEILSCSA